MGNLLRATDKFVKLAGQMELVLSGNPCSEDRGRGDSKEVCFHTMTKEGPSPLYSPRTPSSWAILLIASTKPLYCTGAVPLVARVGKL